VIELIELIELTLRPEFPQTKLAAHVRGGRLARRAVRPASTHASSLWLGCIPSHRAWGVL